jgi:hypothetical protein
VSRWRCDAFGDPAGRGRRRIRGTRKIEALTTSAEGDLVFATSDFDYPPDHFKLEGLVAMPDRELWFGVREVGPDYEHPDYTITILKASYSKADDGTVAVQPPVSVVTRVDPSGRPPSTDGLGLSSLARHDDVLAMLTSREAPPSSFVRSGGDGFTRRPEQGVLMMVEVVGLR